MADFEAPKGPPDISGLYSLKIDNLDYNVDSDELRSLFGAYGEVGDVYMPRDHETKQSRGFAFVRYKDRRDAEASASARPQPAE
jgi:RNA recognition motif-containing protein